MTTGKSSLLLRYTDHLYLPSEETQATIGVDVRLSDTHHSHSLIPPLATVQGQSTPAPPYVERALTQWTDDHARGQEVQDLYMGASAVLSSANPTNLRNAQDTAGQERFRTVRSAFSAQFSNRIDVVCSSRQAIIEAAMEF